MGKKETEAKCLDFISIGMPRFLEIFCLKKKKKKKKKKNLKGETEKQMTKI